MLLLKVGFGRQKYPFFGELGRNVGEWRREVDLTLLFGALLLRCLLSALGFLGGEKLSATFFYHLRNLRHLRNHLSWVNVKLKPYLPKPPPFSWLGSFQFDLHWSSYFFALIFFIHLTFKGLFFFKNGIVQYSLKLRLQS